MTVPIIKIKVLRKPTIKAKMDVRFPANVLASSFVTLTRSGGTYTFGVDYTVLTPGPISDPTTAYIAILDQTSGIYRTVTLASLLTSGLDADLQAIAALTTNGVLVRTGTNTWATRTITGTTNEITVTNGDGVSGAPTISIPANAITNAKMATMAAFTLKGNNTSGAATPTDVDIAALTLKASPAATDLVMISDQAASGAWKRTPISALGGGGSGVSTIAGNTGAFTLEGGLANDVNKLVVQQLLPGGRLTLTSATPVTTTDVTAATAIYYAPATSPFIPIYNGTVMRLYQFTSSATDAVGLSVTLGANWTLNTNYDWFVINDGGTIRLGSGPAWTSDTARGTGAGTTELQMYNGIWTNKNSITIRYANATTTTAAANQATYIGTTRTVAAGQCEDSAAKRFVWNLYNQGSRILRNVTETTATWTYTSLTVRQANATTSGTQNQLDVVIGLAGNAIEVNVWGLGDTSAGGSFAVVGVGVNSTTSNSAQTWTSSNSTNRGLISAQYKGFPAIGRQFFPWLEWAGVAAGTNTYYGQAPVASQYQAGISGTMLM